MGSARTFRARWIFPGDQPPLAGGTFSVADGCIASVDPPGRCQPDVDLGNVAVLPGLANAHTHLDLSALRGRLPAPAGFTDWLRAIVAYRRDSSPTEWQEAIGDGVAESLLGGTTLLGDISGGGFSAPVLAASPLRSTVFHEIIGLTKPRARQTWREAASWLHTHPSGSNCQLGISPHAPFSVRHGLWRLASRRGVPLAIHWAETREEDQLLTNHSGPLRSFLEEIAAWDAEGLAEGRDWIERQLGRVRRIVFVHGNYLDSERVSSALRRPGMAIVYCPRTHAYFGHSPHPFLQLLAAGVNVALGTDSLASNPDLSILEEMRFLWRIYRGQLSGEQLLRMGTLNGAVALGFEAATGSLTTGKSADWITVPLGNGLEDDPYETIFASRLPVRDVHISGHAVVRDGRMTWPLAARQDELQAAPGG